MWCNTFKTSSSVPDTYIITKKHLTCVTINFTFTRYLANNYTPQFFEYTDIVPARDQCKEDCLHTINKMKYVDAG